MIASLFSDTGGDVPSTHPNPPDTNFNVSASIGPGSKSPESKLPIVLTSQSFPLWKDMPATGFLQELLCMSTSQLPKKFPKEFSCVFLKSGNWDYLKLGINSPCT